MNKEFNFKDQTVKILCLNHKESWPDDYFGPGLCLDRGEEKTSWNRLMKVKPPSRQPDSWNLARSRPTDPL